MSAEFVDNLLEDANKVASFGSEAGLLRNSRLVEAIQKVEASRQNGRNPRDIAALQMALNDAVLMIRPVSLVDLHSGWDPIRNPTKPSLNQQLSRYFFIALAFVLIFFCAFYLFWIKDAEAIRTQYEKKKTDSQIELLVDLYDELRTLLPISKRLLNLPETEFNATVDMARATLRQKIDDVYDITQEIEADRDAIVRLAWTLNPLSSAIHFLFGKENSSEPMYLRDYDCLYHLQQSQQTVEGDNDLTDWANVEAFRWRDAYQIQFAKCIAGVEDFQRISSARRLSGEPYLHDRQLLTEYWPRLFEGWILPTLFGALGAVIYHLRICLNRLRPDPRLGRALMRIFLGGFAGLSFGWFVSPAATSEILGRTLPLGAYAIAFLIGYSVDVFYALLDKVVVLISNWIERLGTGNPSRS